MQDSRSTPSTSPSALHLFVGRSAELDEWDAVLGLATPTILHVTGPGGIGKSALLRAFAGRGEAAGVTVKELDARTLEPSLPGLRLGLDDAGLTPGGTRIALLLDTYEQLAVPDFFIRSELLRRMGPHLLVLAGRNKPDAAWFANNGWGVRVVHLPLGRLEDAATTRYLELRGVVGERSSALRGFCQGHPLALALAVEAHLQAPDRAVHPGEDPDLVGALFEQFVSEIPNAGSRAALEVCAVTRHLREDLLADFVGAEAAATSFAWLRKLSFVERSHLGVSLHDVARAVILADLRWRNPSRFDELFASARSVLAQRAEKAEGGDVMQKVVDIQFMMRLAPELRDRLEPSANAEIAIDVATVDDGPLIEEIVRKHEGEASVATFRRWFPEQRERFAVARSPSSPVLGFSATLLLDARAADEPDERIRRVWRHAKRLLGSESGEVLYTPFWMTRDAYQRVDEVRLALGAAMARWLLDPMPLALAYAHATTTELDMAAVTRTGGKVLRDLAFEHGGAEQMVFVYDRRSLTPSQWYVRCLRTMGASNVPDPNLAGSAPLDREQFDVDVRSALRHLHDASQLKLSPLLQARFIGAAPEARGARAQHLRAQLIEHIGRLRGTPQGDRQYRAVHGTFVDVAETQELAAERHGMAYSTFRRYLAAGLARLIDALWSAETESS